MESNLFKYESSSNQLTIFEAYREVPDEKKNIFIRIARRLNYEYEGFLKKIERKRNFTATVKEFGTHMPILEAICDLFSPDVALEFGMGLNSTEFLLKRTSFVFSIEHNKNWYHRTLKGLKSETQYAPVLWKDTKVQDFLNLIPDQKWDLVLVDGPGKSRVPCVFSLLGKADFIVLHDTEACCYNWHRLFEDDGLKRYSSYTFKQDIPWTTVICKDEGKLDKLVTRLNGDLNGKNIFSSPIR